MKWFKLYHEARTDRKLQTLTVEQRWVWFSLLCLSSEQPERGTISGFPPKVLAAEVADGNMDLLSSTLVELRDLRIISGDDANIVFINFEKRQSQKPSDDANATAERKRRQRERERTASDGGDSGGSHAPVTPMSREVTAPSHHIDIDIERDTELETDLENVVPHRSSLGEGEARARASLRAFGITDDEVTRSIELYPEFNDANLPILAEECISYHLGDKRKPPKNRYRAWLNWLRKRREFDARDKAQPVIVSKPVDLPMSYPRPFPDYYN